MENMVGQCLLYTMLLELLAWPLGIIWAKNKLLADNSQIANPAMRVLPACGGMHEKQSLHGAAEPQPAPAFRRTAYAARKKGRDCSRTTR